MVRSPRAIPRQPGDRIKTDTRDTLKLSRLHAAGQLRLVVVRPAQQGDRRLVKRADEIPPPPLRRCE
jgi:hypothetical protein